MIKKVLSGMFQRAPYLIFVLFMCTSATVLSQPVDPPKSETKQSNAEQKEKGTEDTTSKSEGDGVADRKDQTENTPYKPFTPRALPTLSGEVLWIPIHGTIDLGLPPFIERALTEHPEAKAIVLEVDTLGGRVDAAIKIRDLLLTEQRPVTAFIYRRAISAGALISFAADYIVFSDGSTMGAATPIQLDQGQAKAVGEKMVSYFRSEMRTTAEAKGRDGILAEAMVDADQFVSGVSEKGKLLTLTTRDAVDLGVANGEASSPDELKVILGIDNQKVIYVDTSWSEDIARAVTDPTVSGFLMSLGMLGIMIELYTPGLGLAGALGVTSLICFFFGHKVAGLAGSEELMIILLGLILLALEIFVIPGFGIAGILGLFFLSAGFITSMGELPSGVGWDLSFFATPIETFVYSLISTMILAGLIMKYLPESRFGSWLILRTSLSDRTDEKHQYEVDGSALKQELQEGALGMTTTPLRMSGKAEFEGVVYDVISRDEYLDPQSPIQIVNVSGSRILVIAAVNDSSDEV